MNAIRLVAWREYKQYVTTRGFWLSLIIFPLVFGVFLFVPQWLAQSTPARTFVMVDQTGVLTAAVDDALERDYQQRLLTALVAYTRIAVAPEVQASGAIPDLFLDPSVDAAALAAFVERGGLPRALEIIRPQLSEDAPEFAPPRRDFVRVPLPPDVDPNASFDALSDALVPYLTGGRPITTAGDERDLFAAILVPRSVTGENWTGAEIQYWSTNLADSDLRERISQVLNEQLREQEYARQGLDAGVVSAVQSQSATIRSFDPRKTSGDRAVGFKDRVEQIIPLGLAYILWVGIFTVGNMLLTNVVEEKSNKIIEVLLSSVTAHELMIGKLIGILSLGLTTAAVWIGSISLALLLLPAGAASIGAPIVELLFSTPLLPAFLFYFVSAYLIFAAIFLAVGSMCNSLSDSQTYMGPLMMLLIVPMALLAFIPRDPNGIVATVVSWIPIYTPFVMMMRVSADPPMVEVIGTGLLTIVTAVFMLWLMGRLFRRSILRSGQPPKLAEVVRLLRMSER